MSNKKNKYEDGSEKRLFEIFSTNKPYNIDNLDWSMYYHLTPRRHNLLAWYDFPKNKSLLEVGAGCGAITGLFINRLKNVTVIEMEEKRSKVIKERFKDKKNLTVITDTIQNCNKIGKFDYVTCIGVLEYAAKFNNSKKPYSDFLKKMASFLKDNGVLILAIENKYGLKYWSGSGEDHTGKPFDSVNGYPENKNIITFGKKRLIQMLESAGFNDNTFYYPFPDYKLPNEIFSENYKPTLKHRLRAGIIPFYDISPAGLKVFNERKVIDQLSIDDEVEFFSNSFLIFSTFNKEHE